MRPSSAAALAVAQLGNRYRLAKITPDQVRQIRGQIAAGIPQARIAAAFGIARSTVSAIHIGRRWQAVK